MSQTTKLRELGRVAWAARAHAHLHGPTAVGAAAMSTEGDVFAGCNLEHRYRCHDIHAETNAISNMVAAAGSVRLHSILIVAERESFTPCGSCMDWIFELGGPFVEVGFQGKPDGTISVHSAEELMPHYPR